MNSNRAQSLVAAIAAWDRGSPDETIKIVESSGLMREFKDAADSRVYGAAAGPREILMRLFSKEVSGT